MCEYFLYFKHALQTLFNAQFMLVQKVPYNSASL